MSKSTDDHGGSLAALIAYYQFLGTIAPMVVFTTVPGFVLAGDPGFKAQVLHTAKNSLPSLATYIDHGVKGSGTAPGEDIEVVFVSAERQREQEAAGAEPQPVKS